MIPMSFLRNTGKPADYIVTGTWSKKAVDEAKTQGTVQIAFDGKAGNYNRVPKAGELKLDPNAAYAYFTSNETIQGVQFPAEPEVGDVPLVCDASSDFLSRPIPVARYGILFACAQKNAGPAGVTIVIIRDDLLAKAPKDLPSLLELPGAGREQVVAQYAAHVCDLHGETGDRLVASGDWRPGEDG